MVFGNNNGNVKVCFHALSEANLSEANFITDSKDLQDAGFEHSFGKIKLKNI